MRRKARNAPEAEPVAQLVSVCLCGDRRSARSHSVESAHSTRARAFRQRPQGGKHPHRVVRPPAAAAANRARCRRLALCAERLELHHHAKAFQQIAQRRQPAQPLLHVPKPSPQTAYAPQKLL